MSRESHQELNKQYWRRQLWTRGYFVASSGNVTGEKFSEYIQKQDLEARKVSDDFEISDL
ncbi:transposase [Hydrogenoanaerobacterium sp.]|uniref:transposase n=1 Tax=Hydrogenoanaerobacterium sp. TaxID=2953763 RepID=UPI00289AD2F9|nr:transposase [Hydrogenoanaerobacterium sp.]